MFERRHDKGGGGRNAKRAGDIIYLQSAFLQLTQNRQ